MKPLARRQVRITELRLPLDLADGALRSAVLERLGLRDGQLAQIHVFRRAWDARSKAAIRLIYTVDCTLAEGVDAVALLARLAGDRQIRPTPDMRWRPAAQAPADWGASRSPPVRDGREALARLSADPRAFDLVLTDQTMPQLTGVQLARECARLRPDLPVILCTEFGGAIAPDQLAEAGISKLLAKPVEPDELLRALSGCLGAGS